MKVGKRGMKMSDGSVRQFKSAAARARFEKVSQAVKHGFKPSQKVRRVK
jgi:hypothetical protein